MKRYLSQCGYYMCIYSTVHFTFYVDLPMTVDIPISFHTVRVICFYKRLEECQVTELVKYFITSRL